MIDKTGRKQLIPADRGVPLFPFTQVRLLEDPLYVCRTQQQSTVSLRGKLGVVVSRESPQPTPPPPYQQGTRRNVKA